MKSSAIEVKRIEIMLKQAHSGGAWHGPSVRFALRGVDARVAAARPPAGLHSIWEITNHIAAWNRAVTLRISGTRIRLTRAQDWPAMPAPTQDAWREATEELEQSHRGLLRAVRQLSDSALSRKAGSRENDTVYRNLTGTIQHYAYHAGQITLIKRLVRTEP
jgi:uncharacterized damage-inducible protein DinB